MWRGTKLCLLVGFGKFQKIFEMECLDDVFSCVIECLDYQEKNYGREERSIEFAIGIFEKYERWAQGRNDWGLK